MQSFYFVCFLVVDVDDQRWVGKKGGRGRSGACPGCRGGGALCDTPEPERGVVAPLHVL
jgi:hypothetical protein